MWTKCGSTERLHMKVEIQSIKCLSHKINVILPLHRMYELKRRKIAEEEQADKYVTKK